MSLHFHAYVNSQTVAHFYAVRTTGQGKNPNSINAYQVEVRETNDTGRLGLPTTFYVQHRYGDGALGLIEAALSKYREVSSVDHTDTPTHRCNWATLFETCQEDATHLVNYRAWGEKYWCAEHYSAMEVNARSKWVKNVMVLNEAE